MKEVVIKSEVNKDKAVLSERELEILEDIADGLTSKQISEKRLIHIKTVEKHRWNMLKKTEAKNIVELCVTLYKKGILQ